MRYWIVVVIFSCTFCSIGFCQGTYTIKGAVHDSLQQAIAGAGVVIYEKTTAQLVAYGITNNSGHFQIVKKLQPGSYQIEISAINFKKFTDTVLINGIEQTKEIQVILKRTITLLNEVVVVSSATPIKQKGDTTEYNAASFIDPSVKKVEDLLKKLPGIQVNDNGKLTFKGKEVEKVLIEGDDLFDRKYQLLTQNFNAAAVSKIQAIDNYLDNHLLKGIESSDKVALNIKLNESFKNKIAGDLSVGAGSSGFYDTHNAIYNIFRRFKAFLILNGSNASKSAASAQDYLYETPDFVKQTNPFIYAASLPLLPAFKTNRFIAGNSGTGVITSMYNLSKRVKVKNSFNGFTNNQHIGYELYEQYRFSPNLNWQSLQQNNNQRKDESLQGKLEMDIISGDSSSVKYQLGYCYRSEIVKNNSLTSIAYYDTIKEQVRNKPIEWYSNFLYTNRLTARSILEFTHQYYTAKTSQDVNVLSNRYYSFFQTDSSFRQLQGLMNNVEQQQQLAVKFLQVWKRHKLTITPFFISHRYRLNTGIALLNGQLKQSTAEVYQQQNSITENNFSIKLQEAYEWKNWNVRVSTVFQQATFCINNIKINELKKYNTLFINPAFSIAYRIKGGHRLLFSFNREGANPYLSYVLPGSYLKTSTSLEEGSASFAPVYRSSYMFNYNYFSLVSQTEINAGIFHSNTNKNYGYVSIFQPAFAISTIRPFVGSNSSNANFNIGKLVLPLQSNIRLGVFYSNTNFFSSVNGNNNIRNTVQSKGGKLSFNSGFKGFFNYDIRFEYRFSQAFTTVQAVAGKMKSWNGASMFKFQFNRALFVLLKSEWYQFNTQAGANFIDARVEYSPKWSIVSFSVSFNNILNTKKYREQMITTLQENSQTYKVLPFYGLLNIRWSF